MNDEIKKRIEELANDIYYEGVATGGGEHVFGEDDYREELTKLITLYTEMVEGELKEFVEYTNDPKRASGTLRYHLKQYLLERKVN